MNKKGFLISELLWAMLGAFIIIIIVSFIVLGIRGCNKAVSYVESEKEAKIKNEKTHLALYAVGEIVYHKASDEKMVISNNKYNWNELKQGWDIKVKDGGMLDKVGGYVINEMEVKSSLKEVGR